MNVHFRRHNTSAGVDTDSTLCKVALDGRLAYRTAADFDTRKSPFLRDYAKPDDIKWSEIINFPAVPPAVFDRKVGGQPFQVNINDKSLYQQQLAVRRAGLVIDPKGPFADYEAQNGVKTFHWSVRQPAGQTLNFDHEYMNVFHVNKNEDVFNFRVLAGKTIAWGEAQPVPVTNWKVVNVKNEGIWSTPILYEAWQNFAVTLDFQKNRIQVFYSKDKDSLQPVTDVLPNDNSQKGRFHVGLLKKPTGAKSDMAFVKGAFQESAFVDSQIYGGVFVEDSKNGCVTR
ncbi:hypothetical protein EG328_011300 [Venturia inaequalis]|uniref:Glycoside hydrolase 131 catalytic N-terminal domain-containing protein n=1 Tax=Venturia inaequalis TaxID=5025 RepID=A0A8H3V6C1_VENIN|nr:hypothetical protein EG328_011300 [Venturia inaequalis]